MKRIIITLATSLAILSCQHKETDLIEEQTKGNLHAKTENIDSKTTLNDDHKVIWNSGDMVAVFNESTLNQPYLVTDGTEGSVSCDLECTGSSDEGSDVGDILVHKVAYYPYSSEVTCASNDSGGYTISDIEIETEQRYEEGAFASGSFPMVAVNSGDNLSFKNICGAIMVQVKGQVKIRKVTLTGNNKEKLCGKATITAYPDKAPEIIFKGSASTSISLDCRTGVKLSKKTAETFILTIPPTTFEDGFTLIMTDTDGEKHQFKTERKSVISRSCMLVMDVIDLSESDQTETPETPETPDTEETPDTPVNIQHEGIQYIWDDSVIPEITIHMTSDEWNALLERYDKFSHNVDYFHADFTYKKGDEVTFIEDGGVRLRGNTSRRRPEGNGGELHNSTNPDWHHCHFGINFRKFHKDDAHEIKGIRKINLKWFKDDPCYVRELYCYDLFRRYGIWTSAHSNYCRLWLQIDEETPAYYGVYNMIEPIDDKFVSKRVEGMFENKDGFLWKCVYGEGGMADLKTDGGNSVPFWKMNWDQDNGVNYTYEFKGDEEDFAAAKAQLGDFMQKLNGKGEESFYQWINEVCDVEFLLKTYAVNVVVGMWDDHWGNGNNFYLYFNNTDPYSYKVFLLPYDYDNTLGTSNIVADAGRQDPYRWGSSGILMERLMKFDDFKAIYRDALKELVDPANALFHEDASVPRIKAWQNAISPYISNDTGEDMSIYDAPASWGNCYFYRLMETGSNNFFRVKTETINNMQ